MKKKSIFFVDIQDVEFRIQELKDEIIKLEELRTKILEFERDVQLSDCEDIQEARFRFLCKLYSYQSE